MFHFKFNYKYKQTQKFSNEQTPKTKTPHHNNIKLKLINL